MALNIEVLRRAVKWAEAEARKKNGRWNQGKWAHGRVGRSVLRDESGDPHPRVRVDCGTAFCVAGSICAAAGDRFVLEPWENYAPGEHVDVTQVIPKGSREVWGIEDRALDLLGITDDAVVTGDHHEGLFEASNSIEDVRRIATALAAEHGEVL